MKRNNRILVAVTDEEKNLWQEAWKKTVYKSFSEYIRHTMNTFSQGILNVELQEGESMRLDGAVGEYI